MRLRGSSRSDLSNRWHSPEEIAVYLGMPTSVVLALIEREGLPAFSIGGQWRMKLAEVDAWVRRGRGTVAIAGDAEAPGAREATATREEGAPIAGSDRRLSLAHDRFASADFEAATALTRAIAQDEGASAEDRWSASILRLRALIKLARFDEAQAFADALEAPDRAREVERETHRVRISIERGDFAQANRLLEQLCFAPEGLADNDAARVASFLAYIGNCRGSWRLVEQLARSEERFAKIALLGVYIESGAVREAREIADSIDTRDAETRAWLDECDIPLSIFSGELRGLEARLSALSQRASASAVQPCWVDAVTLSTLRGREVTHDLAREDIPRPTGYQGQCLEFELLRNRTRHRGALGEAPSTRALPSDPPWLRVRDELVRAERALLLGDGGSSVAHASAAVSIATASDALPLVLEAWSTMADALVCRGDLEGVREAQAALVALAHRSGSARVAAESRWLAAIVAGELEYVALESAAAEIDCAPSSARRARALLGGVASLDAVDRAVLEALRARAPLRRLRVLQSCGESWTAGWCYDRSRRAVLRSDGVVHDFSARSVQRAILEELFVRRQVSKEALVRAVWGTRDYHPLRHDKRLHVAVHALRENIEVRPTAPTRIVTTPDGYAIGEVERALAIDPPT